MKMEYLYAYLLLSWFVVAVRNEINSGSLIDGDVSIAGMFDLLLSESGECGSVDVQSVISMEAVRWYVDKANTDGNLPFDLGLRYYETCGNSDIAAQHAVDILESYRHFKSSNSSEELIVGLLGPELSSESVVVSSLLSSQPSSDRFLQVSFSATSTELNLRHKYPNFYRVIPDDSVQIEAMVKLMLELEWNRVSILYENDTYGQKGAEDLHNLATENNICVPRMDAISIDSSRLVDVNEVNTILDEIIAQIPQITAVVYIGSMSVANTVLRLVEAQGYRNVPIFLLSESVQLQTEVFLSLAGTEFKKSKGAMTVSAPLIDSATSRNFWSYLRSTLTDSTSLSIASEKNPYLTQVVRQYSVNCGSNNPSCSSLTASEMDSLVADRSPYVEYAMLGTEAMIGALKKTFNTACGGDCPSIDDFKSAFKPRDMVDALNDLTVTFDSIEGTFDETSSDMRSTSDRRYDVYNYRASVTDSSKFMFVYVGYLSNDAILLTIDDVRDYDVDGKELRYPKLRQGTCPTKVCSECIRQDLTDTMFHLPGDFYVIGFASINNRAIPGPLGCGGVRTRHGYQMFLSMKFAVMEFNTRISYKAYRDLFGSDTKIGLLMINSCNNELEIVRRILELHTYGFTLPDGSKLDLTNRILGYIGGQSTDVSLPAALQLTKLKYVQISYSSTNPVLSDKSRFPYFMRIITPDNVQAKAIIAIVKELKGKYIQLMYSEGAYGEGGRDAVIQEAKEHYVCIAQQTKVLESDRYYGYYEIMRRKPHAKIVILFLRSHVVAPFLRDVNNQMEVGEFQFVGSEAWGTNEQILDFSVAQGAIIVAVEMDKNRDLEEYLQNQVPTFDEPNPWLLEYIQTRQQCYFKWSFDKSYDRECTPDVLPTSELDFESDPWCIFVVNTFLSFLKGSATFFNGTCRGLGWFKLCSDYVDHPENLVEVMKRVRMNIYGDGDIYIYDDKGDGLMGYKIYNIQPDRDDRSKRIYSQVGSYSLSTGIVFDVQKVRYPTLSPIVSSCPSEISCKDCQESPSQPGDGGEPSGKTADLGPIVPVLGAIIGVLGTVTIALVICIVVRSRSNQQEPDPYFTPQYMDDLRACHDNFFGEGPSCSSNSEIANDHKIEEDMNV